MVILSAKLPEELHTKIFEEAHRLKMTKSEFIRKCLEGYFKRLETPKTAEAVKKQLPLTQAFPKSAQ